MSMRDEWRYAMMMNGRLSVMKIGIAERHRLFVDNWDTQTHQMVWK